MTKARIFISQFIIYPPGNNSTSPENSTAFQADLTWYKKEIKQFL